jgi:osmotically-inducible protein OsmY
MSEDAHLQQAVVAQLRREPSVEAAHIGVTAAAGVVTLSGHVETFAEKHAAEAAAAKVKGVHGVADQIEVRLADDADWTDEDIAAAAVHRLAWNAAVPPDAVTVTVEDGWITLAGEVEWHFQREAAEQDVRRLLGVVGVSNEIAIKPSAAASHISDDIMHALHRSWFFDPATIAVHVEEGRVRLTGTVHSPHERQVAAETAWAEPGVIDVENDISIV